jgi:lactoylglutathione lyase
MRLAKSRIDVGLFTNSIDELLFFWRNDAGLRLDHVLTVRRGQMQYRHEAFGSVIKMNYSAEPLRCSPASGYRELLVARPGSVRTERLVDPDGNRVTLVPVGHDGITQIGVRIGVSNLEAHRQFYARVLELKEEKHPAGAAFRAGDSLIILNEESDVSQNAGLEGAGWRYITFQVFNVDRVHSGALEAGAREGLAPVTMGTTARISMILDPDGNWIELSQRASLVGSLT